MGVDMTRGIDERFLAAMREKLDHGRRRGRVGWDQHWQRCVFESDPSGATGFLMRRLAEEVLELGVALALDNRDGIRSEAADVANLAMMVADYHGALEDSSEDTDNL